MIRIQALGGLSVYGDDGRPRSGAAAQPRRMAVLALLAHAGNRGVTRERAMALLWPDVDDERARNNLAQAIYALRRDLGDDTIVGTKELRLDPEHVSSDVAEFRAAIARGDDARAAAVYSGPFLEGFHVPGSAELERWMDDERTALEHEHKRVLESLARTTSAAGDTAAALTWWRRLAAVDPLNARVAVGLMEALAAAGDRAGALDHARIYEALLDQELDLPPDRDVVLLAKRLRREQASDPVAVESVATAKLLVSETGDRVHEGGSTTLALDTRPSADASRPEATVVRRRSVPKALIAAALIGVAVLGVGFYVVRNGRAHSAPVPVIAVGRIAGYELGNRTGELTAPLADLLATNLARVPGLRVVSAGRMLELAQSARGEPDTSAGGFTAAARSAGATELVDGTLFGRPDGRLRLDLRRVDVATGAILDVRTVEGADLFALVDSGTARFATRFGARAPTGSVADVTTRSLAAYRLYAEGVRRYYARDYQNAQQLLGAAVREDSTFAMATFYWALTADNQAIAASRLARAVRLSETASDRERLTIRAGGALRSSAPELAAIADTLATRYPDEVQGHLYRGIALLTAQEYAAAVPHLRRAARMDSLALPAGSARAASSACLGCDARNNLVFAYWAMDSLAVAEQEARAWTRVAPSTAAAWIELAGVFDARGRVADARAALDTARALEGGASAPTQNALAIHWISAGDYAQAEELSRVRAAAGTPNDQGEAYWYLAIAYRDQGRLADALAAARRHRRVMDAIEPAVGLGAAPSAAVIEALMLDDIGRHREAAALFDSSSRGSSPELANALYSRNRAWGLTHAADALAAAGDRRAVNALVDTVAAYGARSGLGRDHRLFHHARGLGLAASGDDAGAVEEFRASIRTWTLGYTRSNVEMAGSLLRLRRPTEAVAALQPALRGGVEAANLYVSRTALHELLAQAWEAANQPDSAAAHYSIVARVWRAGDPPFRARAARAAEAAARLGHIQG